MAGLYLHIPFCAQKCHYCDFASFPGMGEAGMARYVHALKNELTLRAPQVGALLFDTVFIGGGTPSLLPIHLMADLVAHAKSALRISPDAEFTCECNPDSASPKLFEAWRGIGVNRVSIGIQSLDDQELAHIGRVHTARQAADAVQMAKDAGYERISVDLICALPGQSTASFAKTLDGVLGLDVGHISCYQLQIEEGTPLARMIEDKKLPEPSEDAYADAMALAVQTLCSAGYERYEVSNFALPGEQCRHNLGYWRRTAYLGTGLSAHSLLNGVRMANTDNLEAYLAGQAQISAEALTPQDVLEETVMLSLRTSRGLDAAVLNGEMKARADKLCQNGLLSQSQGRYAATQRGFEVLNAVIGAILFG